MKIFLTKNVEKIGLAGEILKVADGFAQNFLFPRKLAVQVTPENEAFYTAKIKKVEQRKEVIASSTSMLAETIKTTKRMAPNFILTSFQIRLIILLPIFDLHL